MFNLQTDKDGGALVLLTIDEVAAQLPVSVGTIRTLREQGRFAPALRVGRHLRWEPSDVRNWALEQREAS